MRVENHMLVGEQTPSTMCYKCVNTGRVGKTKEDIIDWFSERVYSAENGELTTNQMIDTMQIMLGWFDDRCVPCPECEL